MLGGTQQASVSALAALGAEGTDPAALSAHIATMTTAADALHKVGLKIYALFHDGVVARMFTAAGQPDRARVRLDTALRLARDTGVRYYDAELLRLRADTFDEPEGRSADIGAALKLARRQGATLYELRSALADFELHGEPGRTGVTDALSRFPANSGFPELTQAGTALSSTDPQSLS